MGNPRIDKVNPMSRLFVIGLGLLLMQTVAAQLQFGPGAGTPGERLDGIVAVVEDDVITHAELDRELAGVQRQINERGATPPPPEVLRRQVLESMIIERLQLRTAERRGIVVDDPSLDAAVESIARQNQLNLEQLRQAVLMEGMDFAEFREDVRRQVLAQRLRQQVIDRNITVSEQEVENALGRVDLGTQTREYRLAQILIAVSPNADARALAEARSRMEQVIEQLQRGADFQQLAVAASDGREALDGGDLGWLSAASLPAVFADVVPQLSPGQIAPPVRSPQGYHLLLLLDRRQQVVDAAAQRSQVREALLRRKAEEEWELWLRQLRDQSYVEIRL